MTNLFAHTQLSDYLKALLNERQLRNESYSLRAFAQSLGLSAPMLSSVLQNKRALSPERAQVVSDKLKLKGEHATYFSLLAKQDSATDPATVQNVQASIHKLVLNQDQNVLETGHIGLFSDWYYSPLLSMIKFSKEFNFSPESAAQKLKIPLETVQDALERLVRMGLVVQKKDTYVCSRARVLLQSEGKNEALQRYHQIMLEHVKSNLAEGSPDKRFVGTETLAFDESLLPEANKILNEACDRILALTQKSDFKNSIYHLNVSFTPLVSAAEQEVRDEEQKQA